MRAISRPTELANRLDDLRRVGVRRVPSSERCASRDTCPGSCAARAAAAAISRIRRRGTADSLITTRDVAAAVIDLVHHPGCRQLAVAAVVVRELDDRDRRIRLGPSVGSSFARRDLLTRPPRSQRPSVLLRGVAVRETPHRENDFRLPHQVFAFTIASICALDSSPTASGAFTKRPGLGQQAVEGERGGEPSVMSL
jgi:hypothetical protein